METAAALLPQEVFPPADLPDEDGVPLESDWHRLAMTLLIELVGRHLPGRDDYFVGGNMFIYFDIRQTRGRHFRGPDFFFVWDAALNPPRRYWAVWDEGGKYPDVIIELSSPTTKDEDHGPKKTTYERIFHTSEYFIHDPFTQELRGWRLDGKQHYQEIQANDKGWLWSEQLGLWLGTWTGFYQGKQEVYLRFFDKDANMVLSAEEQAAVERQRADAERQRAETAEAELARIKAERNEPASD